MSSVTISGDTSGSVILQAPSVAGSTTLTLPTTTGTLVTSNAMPTGSVLQVVQATYGTIANTSSATLTATGLSASITPSNSSNKILACINMAGTNKTANNTALWLALYRNGSNIFNIADIIGYNNSTSSNNLGTSSGMYLDSPATTSSITYAIYFASSGNNTSAGINNYFGAQSYVNSTLTLMEIKG